MAENFNFGYDLFDYPVTDIEKSPKFLVLGTVPCLIIIIFFWGGVSIDGVLQIGGWHLQCWYRTIMGS